MCGIVGMAGDFSYQEKDAFTDMLTVCQVRGRDSTGVFSVKNGPSNEVRWMKDIGTPDRLIESKHYDKWLLDGVPKVLVGHTRYKTTGGVSRHNAHPFDFDHVIGVHNGTLANPWKLDHYKEYDVDSQALYRHINDYGLEETISQLPAGSAYALVWWDKRENTLNFLRNEKRPLYFTWSEDLKVMLWASETWMFGAYYRAFKLWNGGEDKEVFYELPVDTVYSFEVDGSPGKDGKALKMRPMRVIQPTREAYGNSVIPFHGPYGTPWDPAWDDDEDEAPIYNGVVVEDDGKEGDTIPVPFRSVTDPDALSVEASRNAETQSSESDSQAESSNTKNSSDNSKKSSLTTSDSEPGTTSSTSTKRRILSTTSLTSNNSASSSSGKSSASCETVSSRVNRRIMTSVRTVAGISYITDNMTKQEWSFQQFHKNTDGICGFCNKPIGDEREVFAFIKPEKFICCDCVGSNPESEDVLILENEKVIG